jgi:hypothetical protein
MARRSDTQSPRLSVECHISIMPLEPREVPLAMIRIGLRAQRRCGKTCDSAAYMAFCQLKEPSPLPAKPETVASFVDARRLEGKKPATIRRYSVKPREMWRRCYSLNNVSGGGNRSDLTPRPTALAIAARG